MKSTAAYTEEQFIYFTTKLNQLESVKENRETYWYEYRKLQDWLQEQQLSTSFIRWVEERMKK
ncbi:hypothetical protein COM33_24990 [Bacillus toyonensis]|uniref:hypothetical protein n=1 Tax=Bacillus TaxID=1386 RepID=UPI0001A086E5|nr:MULTISPECIES: hypothetical protein [Bacillus]EEL19759.1 hypothetical protein bcere0017_54670 [Bacillus cereus Rock1-3]KXY15899.1 hypothetical protein AT259_02310 [Bacillus cereus]MDH8705373.1 hypothetical protein [Stenotrophomonas sp. 1198]KAB2401620.1 hypothetical protein F8514_28690 [Bacillus toyonensis]MBY7135785.1 hypothetical protein [Bacillus sp. 12RED03]